MELVNAIPSNWKNNLKHSNNYSKNLLDHLLLKSNCLFYIEKLESTKFYCIINSLRNNKPMSQIYFEKKFHWKELDCGVIYALPRNVITNTYLKSFQFKILTILFIWMKNFLSLNFLQHHFGPFAILLVTK